MYIALERASEESSCLAKSASEDLGRTPQVPRDPQGMLCPSSDEKLELALKNLEVKAV